MTRKKQALEEDIPTMLLPLVEKREGSRRTESNPLASKSASPGGQANSNHERREKADRRQNDQNES